MLRLTIACTLGLILVSVTACDDAGDPPAPHDSGGGAAPAAQLAAQPSLAPTPSPTPPPKSEPAPQTQPEPARPAELEAFTQTVPICLVEFEMLPVPGGEGVEPFYLAKTELSWDAFAVWAFCEDIDRDESLSGPKKNIEKIKLRNKKLRPSAPYDDIFRGYGREDRAALGMSRLSVELYCKWLSEKTGKKYRLPTKAEWLHAYRLNHGDPDAKPDQATLDAIGWHEGNSDYEPQQPATATAGKLGHHDMLGNLSEWVTDTGDDRLVLGGHFLTPPEEMKGTHAIVEDETWNENYPNEPKSIWWFVDAEWVGARLVCEPGAAKSE